MRSHRRLSRPRSGRVALLATVAAGFLVAACSDLPINERVRQHCANVPADQWQACEDAEYARIYAQERYQNRRISYP